MTYYNGVTKEKVYRIRHINKVNYHSMCHNLIDQGGLKDCFQILVKFLDQGYVWINVNKNDLIF